MKHLFLAAMMVATMMTTLFAGMTARGQDGEAGLLLPVGGGYADVYPGIVAAFLEAAVDGAVNITVLPATYSTNAGSITAAEREVNLGDAERRRFEIEEACKRAAGDDLTCTARIAPIFTRADAEDPENLAFFDAGTDAVFILGGDQGVAMAVLANTPVEDALVALHERGGVIAGTSAGGAVQSRAMIAGYSRNFAAGNAFDRGAADLWNDDERRGLIAGIEGAILDQHFFQRGRLGRLTEAIVRPDAPHVGIGVDAYTGLRVENGTVLTGVFGLYTVAVLDAATYGAAESVRYVGDRETISVRNLLVHLLAPGDSSYDLAARRHSLDDPAETLTRTFDALALPAGAGALLLTGGLVPDSPVWERFLTLTGEDEAPLLVVAAGYPNERPAQRAADKVGKQLGGAYESAVLSKTGDDALAIDGDYRGIVVLARDQSLLQPARLAAIKDAWRAGVPLLLDGAAATLAGPLFSAHGPTPEDTDAAEIATQRSFLEGRTVITDGLALLDIALEPALLADNRWGRLFSLAFTNPASVILGVADNSALLMTEEGASVIGENVVLSLDLRDAALGYGDNRAFVIANGLIDVFAPGDEVRFMTARRERAEASTVTP